MSTKAQYQINQLRDYSSLFSRNEVKNLLKGDFKSINYKIERYDQNWLKSNKVTYLDYLKYVYSILSQNYQNEYVFKNEFLNEWLISEVGDNDSKVFSEFRVGNAVADLAMFNGKSKIFEIKTELDSDSRLSMQIENYSKAFNQIFLIVPESKLTIYQKYDSNVGLITFDKSRSNTFILQRDAKTITEIDRSVLMQILHSKEYKAIVENYFGKLPDITSFNQFNICSELIKGIPTKELNILFIDQIKMRGNSNQLSSRYYKEFNQLFLAFKMNKMEKVRMIEILKTPLY
jgi:hypothetical protein